MKKLILAIFIALVSVSMPTMAQDDMYGTASRRQGTSISVKSGSLSITQEEKLAREAQRKAMQQKIDSMQCCEALAAVSDTAFTLEADNVVFKYGERAYVTPSTNFVSVADGRAVIQTSFNIPVAGPNGMGGITVDGSVSKYEVSRDKQGNTTVSFFVMGTVANCQVNILLYAGSNKASIDLFPTFSSDRLTLEGVILPNSKSFVVQGRTI